jgi:beta-aspartyl-dipeptidase (metallo-type)
MSHSSAPLILLRNAEVFAPEALGRRQLLLGGGRILSIGTESEPVPSGMPLEVIDCDGLRLVPGFIDGHVHVTGGGGEGGIRDARAAAAAVGATRVGGVTSVIGLLGTDDVARGGPRDLVATVNGLARAGPVARGRTLRRLPPAAGDADRQRCAAIWSSSIALIGAGRSGAQRSSLQPADARRTAAAWRRMSHVAGLMSWQGRHRAPAPGRWRARARSGAARAGRQRDCRHACSSRRM